MSIVSLFNLRSDIQLILQKSTISQDSRIVPNHLNFLIKKHRSRGIREEYGRNFYISPSWLQDLGSRKMTLVNSAEDPAIDCGSIQLGKIVLPQVVDLPDDRGLYKISTMSQSGRYFPISMSDFFALPPGSDQAKFNYFFRVGLHLYTYKPLDKARITVILDDPLEGDFFDNTWQTVLVIGTSYTVYNGTIVSNSVTYNPGVSFVATATTFTGIGAVKFTNFRRPLTERDPFPMSLTLAEFIAMKIFTEEFKVEPQQIADIKNDAAEQLSLLQPMR